MNVGIGPRERTSPGLCYSIEPLHYGTMKRPFATILLKVIDQLTRVERIAKIRRGWLYELQGWALNTTDPDFWP